MNAPHMLAGQADLLVVGSGIAGLVAARRAAIAGASVAVLEASDRAGGMLRRATLQAPGEPALEIDLGAEAFAKRGGAVEPLLEELGLGGELVDPRVLGSWGYADGEAYRMPSGGILGIPGDPTSPEVVAALGEEGAARAARDLEGGAAFADASLDAPSLDELVRSRMGDAVADRLVTPVARGVYSLDASELDPRQLVPGLAARLADRGSLAVSIRELREAAPPGAAVRGVRGGMHRIVTALLAELRELGVPVRTGARVVALERGEQGWIARLEGGREVRGAGVLATVPVPGMRAGEALQAEEGPALDTGSGDAATSADARAESASSDVVPVEAVALLVEAPELDEAPRGTGVLVGEPLGPVLAKALTHSSAKWEWLDLAAGPGRHVIRLSYPVRSGSVPVTAALDEAALAEQALEDAGELLGSAIPGDRLLALARQIWWMPAPAARIGRAERLAALRAEAEAMPGLALAGTWIDGTGLASVVPGAERAVARLLG